LLQKYQWGFSFVQLLVMNIMLLVWIIGMLLMWAVARATLQQQNRSNITGEYKATVELAASMRKELSEEPDELLDCPKRRSKNVFAVLTGVMSLITPLSSRGQCQ
jgi:uncharacterized protein YpmS